MKISENKEKIIRVEIMDKECRAIIEYKNGMKENNNL